MLDKIYKPINSELGSVKDLLNINLTDNEYYREIGNHLKQRQGKFIRSVIILLLNKFFNGNTEEAVKLAVSCETMHLASLLHDDVIDNSNTRRGIESVNSKFGNKMSILMGDYLYCRAFKNLPQEKDQILNQLLEASESMCEGEALQMFKSFKTDINIEDNVNIIQLKTASLFKKIAICAGILNSLNKNEIEILGEFGEFFGVLFQLTDDLLDFTADKNKLGKPVFSDLKEGYYTVPVINILNSKKYSEKFKLILSNEKIENFESEIRDLMDKSDSISKTSALINEYKNRSIDIIKKLNNNNEIKNHIINLVNFTVKRVY